MGDPVGAQGPSLMAVLFTDLVGSTSQRIALGEETADALRHAHDELLADAVGARGGQVVKSTGDGIMATFPGAAEAVAGAIAIQQAIDRYNRRPDALAPLSVRIGVSLGDVTTEGDDVFGTPVIEAARLCAAAEGGQILVADVVRLLAGSRAGDVFVPVGELALKGLPGPVSTSAVRWEPSTEPLLALPGGLVPVGGFAFVGRNAELDRLDEAWAAVVAGERRALFVAGEPGIGKTRLVSQFATRSEPRVAWCSTVGPNRSWASLTSRWSRPSAATSAPAPRRSSPASSGRCRESWSASPPSSPSGCRGWPNRCPPSPRPSATGSSRRWRSCCPTSPGPGP